MGGYGFRGFRGVGEGASCRGTGGKGGGLGDRWGLGLGEKVRLEVGGLGERGVLVVMVRVGKV